MMLTLPYITVSYHKHYEKIRMKKRTRSKGAGETADNTRQRILQVATKKLSDGGPDAIRLKEIAEDVGVSHPTILHHFGSRAGLIDALEEDRGQRLLAEMSELLLRPVGDGTPTDFIQQVFKALADSGHARLWAWRGLTLAEGEHGGQVDQIVLRQLTDAVHARRAEYARVHELDLPTQEDSVFVMRLFNSVLLGEAIAGSTFDYLAELDGQHDAKQRFQLWLGELLTLHIHSGVTGKP